MNPGPVDGPILLNEKDISRIMKKYIALLAMLVVSLFASASFAFTPPAPTGFVTDTMGILKPGQVKALSGKISAIKASTQNEIGVLVIPAVGDENIEDITHQTFKAWKVGAAGLDNGVLIVLAINSHKMRIQTGKGVEGDLPDILCNDIMNKMKLFLRTNDVAGALNMAIDSISAKLESRKGQKADKTGPGAQFNKPLPVVPSDVSPATTTTNTTTTPAPHAASCSTSGAGFSTGDATMSFVFFLFVGLVVGYLYSRSKRLENERKTEADRQRNLRLAEQAERKAQVVADERALHEARKRRAEELERERLHTAETIPSVQAAPSTAPVRKATAEDVNRALKAAELRQVLLERKTSKEPYVPTVPRPTPITKPSMVAPVVDPVVVATAAVVTAAAVTAMEEERQRAKARRQREAEEISIREHEQAEARRAVERQEREAEAQARRERDEEERRERQRERDEDERLAALAAAAAAAAVVTYTYESNDSSSSGGSSYDSGSSSPDSGSSDSGFGGGDSGGGGASSDW